MECAITPEKPMGREVFYRALVAAERHAGLPKLDGSTWARLPEEVGE